MISLQDVCFTYPSSEQPVLNSLNLHVEPLSWTVVCGPDGSGKTTLCKLVKGLLKPDRGTINVRCDPAREVGYLGGDPYDWLIGLTVEEDVVFGLESLGLSVGEIGIRTAQALDWTGLSGMEKRLTHTLSGGEQQKIALAGVLAMGCRVLILDEALNMLDRPTRRTLRALIAGLRSDRGLTVIEVTNGLTEALSRDKIVFLSNGSISFAGSPCQFLGSTVGRPYVETAGGLEGLSVDLFQRGVLPTPSADPSEVTAALLQVFSHKQSIS
jgi:energy-coupling factor transporter ATP-binding protein EcfA2